MSSFCSKEMQKYEYIYIYMYILYGEGGYSLYLYCVHHPSPVADPHRLHSPVRSHRWDLRFHPDQNRSPHCHVDQGQRRQRHRHLHHQRIARSAMAMRRAAAFAAAALNYQYRVAVEHCVNGIARVAICQP